jgi:hypothetical protein
MISLKSLGVALLSLGISLPIIVYVAGQVFNRNVASYGGPPDQGAMVLAYIGFIVASALGAWMAFVGLLVLVATRRSATRVKTERSMP